jgi:hypothetical protein
MATAVKTRPNFYEVLGLTPAATDAEIGDAFAREIILSRMRAFGGTAHVSIAYETLRDPAKRKAYDESIGIRREPPPPAILPRAVSFRSSAHFIGAPPLAERTPPKPEAKVEEPPVAKAPEPEWPVARGPAAARESRIAPFIAASLRRSEEAVAPPAPVPSPERKPADLPRYLTQPRAAKPVDEATEEPGFDLKRPAVIGGAVIAAVAVIGAWAGIQAGNEVEAADESPATNQVTVAVPEATVVSEPTAEAARALPSGDYRRRAPVVAARREQPAPVVAEPKPAVTATAQTGPFDSEPTIAAATAPEQPAEESRLIEAAAKNLPLSHAAIAQTIRRIGYPCGQVASTSQILGGMYRVTCTSGDSYRAAPVHGRYRFKRLGSH